MKSLFFIFMIIYLMLFLQSCSKKPDKNDLLAYKLAKSKSYIEAVKLMDTMMGQIVQKSKSNREDRKRHQFFSLNDSLHSSYMHHPNKVIPQPVQKIMNDIKEYSLAYSKYMQSVYKEFPELKMLSKSDLKNVFAKAKKLVEQQ